jgi:hypothetical protein
LTGVNSSARAWWYNQFIRIADFVKAGRYDIHE